MKVNEIFYSLQGEGHYAGVPAVFLRLAGCNLRCWFCDTDFTSYTDMSEEEIVAEVSKYPARHIVITGGEPSIQLNGRLTQLLHAAGFYIQMETNGTRQLESGCEVDWITCSPKSSKRASDSDSEPYPLKIQRIDELKVVYEGREQNMSHYDGVAAKEYRLQPCDVQDEKRNQQILEDTIQFILDNPKWKLSLQTHKIINVR